jgi:cytochrome P450
MGCRHAKVTLPASCHEGGKNLPIPIMVEHLSQRLTNPNQTLRWRPVAAGGVPHVLIQDDKYGDYVLPKGTILFANTWSIHRTGEYANPDEFIPERFLDNEYGIAAESIEDEKEGMRRPLYGFGAGRRACSGQRLAENSLVSPDAH